MLEACPISDALITRIPADEEPLCGNAAVYSVIIIIIVVVVVVIILLYHLAWEFKKPSFIILCFIQLKVNVIYHSFKLFSLFLGRDEDEV